MLPGLASCRRSAGLSQDELTRRAGLARETIIRLEGGRSAWAATVRRLATALGVMPGTLTGRPGTNPPDTVA
jgi:transcriptional regulator with XRE-family HTH domain